jgi:hypothetical protein
MKKVRKALLCSCAALAVSLAAISAAHAQVPYTEGTVERIVRIHILPGHSDAFYADFKTNVIPIFESEKSAGLIVSYRTFTNLQASGPEDWDFGYAIVYANMAALDGLPDKVYDLRMKHYGDHQAEQKVIDKRVENARLVSTYLIRDVTLR